MKKITPAFIRTLTPRAKRYTGTEDNLLWRVLPSGRVVFESITQIKGRTTTQPLATFDSNKIDKAQRDELQKKYAEHYLDYMGGRLPDTPLEEAQKQRETKKAADRGRLSREEEAYEENRRNEGGWELYAEENPEEMTFIHLCQAFIEQHGRFKKSMAADERMVASTLKPLHSLPLFAIDRKRLIAFLKTVNGKVYPNRVRAFLSKLFNWAVDNDYIEASPALRLPQNPEFKRTRILSDAEIAIAWPIMRPIHRFLLVTGQRRSEVAGMLWSHLVDNRWTLPETKNATQHMLRLPELAIRQLPEREGHAIWKGRDGDWPVHKDTVTDWWGADRGAVGLDDVTVHDLRRTAITNLTRVTGDATIGRKVANQTLQGVDARYNLFAWDDEKADALEKWSKFVRELVSLLLCCRKP